MVSRAETVGGAYRGVDRGGGVSLRKCGSVHWLVLSLFLSVVLTLVLNVVVRAFPDLGDRIERGLAERQSRTTEDARSGRRHARVFVSWKAMIVGSVVLTILVNVARWLVWTIRRAGDLCSPRVKRYGWSRYCFGFSGAVLPCGHV